MTWKCGAIDHGVTIFPNGQIGPCCQIKADYLKPIQDIVKLDRFADLKTETPPAACAKCVSDEYQNIPSYRQKFNQLLTDRPGLQFVDIRNTNVCNLKCRYCGPHFSNRWAEELNIDQPNKYTDYQQYNDILLTEDLQWIYFTGGEPLINPEHWALLEKLVELDYAKNIFLQYNTNLTTIKFKDVDILDLWKKFKKVVVFVSVDTTGAVSDQIRSGSNWDKISKNIETLQNFSRHSSHIEMKLSPVLSILNLWSIKGLFEYAVEKSIPVDVIVLNGPDYLALDVVPDELKPLALETLTQIKPYLSKSKFEYTKHLIENNINQCLFNHTVQHVLLLDKLRNENLFDHLPFKQLAINNTLKNYEYQ